MSPALKRSLFVALAPFAFGAYYMAAPSTMPLITGDSPGYMHFSTDRPIGYPLFLFVLKHLTGHYSSIPYVQIFVFCLVTFLLGIELHKYGKPLLLAFLVELGVLGHPGPIGFANSIMSDSLSASANVAFIMTLVHFIEKPSQRRFTLVCTIVAVAICLRPINLALLPATGLLALIFRTVSGLKLQRTALLIVAGAALGIGVTPAANMVIHGSFDSSSPTARGLLQKAIFMDVRDSRLESSNPDATLIESAADPVNDYLRTVPRDIRDLMRYSYSQVLRFDIILPGLETLHPRLSASQMDGLIMRYTLRRFAEDPAAVVRQTIREYCNLITNYTYLTSEERSRYLEFVKDHPPVMPTSVEPVHHELERKFAELSKEGITVPESAVVTGSVAEPPKARPYVLVIGLRTAQLCSILISFALVWPLWLRIRGAPVKDTWVLLGLIALTAQLQLLVTSVVEMAQPRYIYPVWPLLWVILILASYEALANWRSEENRLRPASLSGSWKGLRP